MHDLLHPLRVVAAELRVLVAADQRGEVRAPGHYLHHRQHPPLPHIVRGQVQQLQVLQLGGWSIGQYPTIGQLVGWSIPYSWAVGRLEVGGGDVARFVPPKHHPGVQAQIPWLFQSIFLRGM